MLVSTVCDSFDLINTEQHYRFSLTWSVLIHSGSSMRSHTAEKREQKKVRQNEKETSASSLWLLSADRQSKRKKRRATV